MPKVLQDAVKVVLVGHAIIVDIENARLAFVALHANEILPVHHFVQVAIPIAYGFGVRDRIQLAEKLVIVLLLLLCEMVGR
jgi:hypothetical protein